MQAATMGLCHMWWFVVSDKDSGFPISTKEDKEVHGIGLKNIRKCAVKYGGDMDCIVKGNKFVLSVMVKS